MTRRTATVTAGVAHLVGPGRLNVRGERLVFSMTGKGSTIVDPTHLSAVFCYGAVQPSDSAIRMLLDRGVSVSWLTRGGRRCHGRLVAPDRRGTGLRLAQHRALADDGVRLGLARAVVAAKLESQLEATLHYQKHARTSGTRSAPTSELRRLLASVPTSTLASLRGLEGHGSRAWFRFFGHRLKDPWHFERRVRRPPTDPVNALLSLGYTWVLNRTVAQCEAHGFEVALGALHEPRSGRPSLACDVMEPLRVLAVDRTVLRLCNRDDVRPDGFELLDTGGMKLKRAVFPRVLSAFEKGWIDRRVDRRLEAEIDRFTSVFRGVVEEGE